MKKRQIYCLLLLIWLLILPFVGFAAAATPDYVGISEEDEIIWDTTFDEGPYEDYLEDRYGWDDDAIDAHLDLNPICDDETDEDVIGWKYYIIEIKDEREYDLEDTYPYSLFLDDDEYPAVPYLYNFHIMEEDSEEWEEEDTNERNKIYEYDRDLYATFLILFGPSRGLFAPVIDKDVNWDRVIDKADEGYERHYGDYAGASRPKETAYYFYERDAKGVKTFLDKGEELGNDEVGEFESKSLYTNDGILKYYEWSYDGDAIYLLELKENWIVTNWWIIAVIAVVAVIIVIIIIVIKRR
jgi:hypothetical protein